MVLLLDFYEPPMTATASNLRLGSMMRLCGGHWRPFLPIPILSGLIDRCDTPVVLDRRRRLFVIETVSRLAMHRIIADQQHLVPHPQRDTEDVFDAEEDNTRPHDVPADDEQETDDLDPDLTAVVRDGPAGGVTDPEGGGPRMPATTWVWMMPRVSSTRRKKKRLPRIFMLNHGIEPEMMPMTMAAQPEMTPAAGVMATRPVIMPCTEPRIEGFLYTMVSMKVQVRREVAVQMLVFSTATPASGFAAYCRGSGNPIETADTHRITTVEPGPTDPEDPRADHDESQIARAMLGSVDGVTRSDDCRRDEACCARRDVDDVPTRVVDDAELVEESSTPNGEGDDRVGEGDPQGHEDHPREEVHTAEDSAGKNDGRDSAGRALARIKAPFQRKLTRRRIGSI